MSDYELDPAVLRELPDDTPMVVYIEPAVLRLKRRTGSRLAPISTTLGDVRRALQESKT